MLVETNLHVITQPEQTGIVKTIQRENILKKTEVVGESAIVAYDKAVKWVEAARQKSEGN